MLSMQVQRVMKSTTRHQAAWPSYSRSERKRTSAKAGVRVNTTSQTRQSKGRTRMAWSFLISSDTRPVRSSM